MAKDQPDLENDKKISLNIITPRGVKFVEKADMIVMRCIDGDLGVLPGHESISVVLGDGVLRIHNEGVVNKLAVFGGIAEIGGNTVNIMSTIAQRPEEIDLERAEADRQKVEASMEEETEEHNRRLQVLLYRSLVRIHVSQTEYYEEDED